MSAIQFIGGAAAGFAAAWAAAWLVFVYPFAGMSLRWLWWGLAAGAAIGVVSLLKWASMIARGWPMD